MSIETPTGATMRMAPRASLAPTNGPVSPQSGVTGELVPGSPLDRPIECVECGQTNGPERNFCSGCGKSLRDTCPRCQAPHARSEKFCGRCGLNISEYLAERDAFCRERLAAAERLKLECRFDDALQRLKEVLALTDPRLASFVRSAQEELRALHAERLRREQEAADTLTSAQTALANHAVERAIMLLDGLPEPLRTSAHRDMLSGAQARWKEILGLSGQIRTLLAEKKTLDLSAPLERLLALKPDHREARQLAEQLAAKLVDSARKKIQQRDFDDALGLLRRIPSMTRPPQADELEAEAHEAIWLTQYLRRAAYVTPMLAEVSARTTRTSAPSADLTRIAGEITQRQRMKPRTEWLAAPEWSVPPTAPAAGAVAHWVGRFSRVEVADGESTAALVRFPSRWFVACGLALQGLGRAAVDVNLAPQEKGSFWNRLPFGAKRKPCASAWGIDIGPSSLKAVRMTWDEKQQEARIVEAVFLATADVVERGGESANGGRDELIRAFLTDRSLEGHRVCVNLPGLFSLGRWFTVPTADAKRTTAAIEFEAKRQVAFPLDELAWDYAVLEGAAGGASPSGDPPTQAVSMIAAKLHVVQSHLKSWTNAGVQPDVLQSDGIALHNWLRYDHAAHAAELTGVLDVGSDSTNILFSGPTMLWFRTVGVGGDEVTKALARESKLDRSGAEQWKHSPAQAPRLSQFAATVEPVFGQLLGEYQRSLTQLAALSPASEVARILCLGGAAASWGLVDVLRSGEF